MSTTATETLTIDEFLAKYGHCSGVELVNGRVVWEGQEDLTSQGSFVMPKFKHGVVCSKTACLIGNFVEANDLGWTASNDTFVRVSEKPATVRGADVLFISYARLPKGSVVEDLVIPPDLVIEVRSPHNTTSEMLKKVGEYLASGVRVVVVLDPDFAAGTIYRENELSIVLHNGDELTLPDVLPGFSVPVRKFFE